MKKKNAFGMTLIETVLSMWIFGIVVLSAMTVFSGHAARNTQEKLLALSIARSELERCRLSAEINGKLESYAVAVAQCGSRAVGKGRNYSSAKSEEASLQLREEINRSLEDVDGMDAYKFQETVFSCFSKNKGSSGGKNAVFDSSKSALRDYHGYSPFIVIIDVSKKDDVSDVSVDTYYAKDLVVSVFWLEKGAKGKLAKKSLSFAGSIFSFKE